jgi:lipoyl(octanoyl) transferase
MIKPSLQMIDTIQDKINWKISDGLVDFEQAVSFMEEEMQNIIDGKSNGTIWLCEHPSIFTAGISAKEHDLINDRKLPVFNTNRGGQYTYHGPGIKIIYVMINIKKLFAPEKPDIARFVKMLEDWIINVLDNFDIKGEIRKDRVGIWVRKNQNKEDKISAIGIKVKKWVSYHGIALNVNPDLSFFTDIIPCGIKEERFGVTSLEKLGKKTTSKKLNQIIKDEFNNLGLDK